MIKALTSVLACMLLSFSAFAADSTDTTKGTDSDHHHEVDATDSASGSEATY